jgi:hypothetical protein
VDIAADVAVPPVDVQIVDEDLEIRHLFVFIAKLPALPPVLGFEFPLEFAKFGNCFEMVEAGEGVP